MWISTSRVRWNSKAVGQHQREGRDGTDQWKNERGKKVKGQSARRAVLYPTGPSLSKQLFKLSNGDLKKGDVVKKKKERDAALSLATAPC